MRLPPNIHAAPLVVQHSDLELWDAENSRFKAHCPACKTGLLLVARDPQSLSLIRNDRCVSCGQRVIYTDDYIGGEAVGDNVCAACGHVVLGHHPEVSRETAHLKDSCACCNNCSVVTLRETHGVRLYLCRCGHDKERHGADGRCVESNCFQPCMGFALRDRARGGSA